MPIAAAGIGAAASLAGSLAAAKRAKKQRQAEAGAGLVEAEMSAGSKKSKAIDQIISNLQKPLLK